MYINCTHNTSTVRIHIRAYTLHEKIVQYVLQKLVIIKLSCVQQEISRVALLSALNLSIRCTVHHVRVSYM